MPAPRRIAALAVTASLLGSPAAALAQNGAGDEQYSDPFSGTSTTSKPKAKPQAQAAPSATTTQQPAPAPSSAATSTPSATAQQGAGQLPRTGFDVLPLVLLGVALIGTGAVLLRRRGA